MRFFLLLFLLAATACGGRLPSSRTTTTLIRKHFNSYGKKYESGVFGNKKVSNVEFLKMEEIHKHFVVAIAFVTLAAHGEETPDVYKVRVTIEKGPFGWRYVAWENLGGG